MISHSVRKDGRMATPVLDDVRAMREKIRSTVPTMDEARRLDDGVVDELRRLGVYEMVLPTSLGGPGCTPIEQFAVLEELTVADASVGWCAMIGADTGYYPGFLDDDAMAALYPRRGLITAGKAAPNGKAQRCADGWSVSGRWDFCSGSSHADRFVGGVTLLDESGDQLVDEVGFPVMRVAYLPTDAVRIKDTWDTIGLRGTASNDYSVKNAVVPDNWVFDVTAPMVRTDQAIYRLPWWFLVKVSAVHTGIARRAIDEAVHAAENKMLFPEFVSLIDRPGTLETIARAEATARSARAFVLDEMARLWQACLDDGDRSKEAAAPLRLAMVNAAEVACDVARSMADLLTTTSIKTGSVHARLAADAAVANTHVSVGHRSWTPLGARLTGRSPGGATIYI